MSEGLNISSAVADGGVSIADTITSPVHSATGVELSGLSSSATSDPSDPPTHSAQPSLIGSESNSPSYPHSLDHHSPPDPAQIVFANPDAPEQNTISPPDLIQPEVMMPQAIAMNPETGLVFWTTNENASPVAPTVMYHTDTSDPFLMEIAGSEDGAHEDPSVSEPNEENQEDGSSTPISFSHEAEDVLSVPPQFFPRMNNHDIDSFLQIWRMLWLNRKAAYPYISDEGGSFDIRHKRGRVSAKSMEKSSCTIQGINWSQFQTTSSSAREMRRMMCRNFINMPEINNEQPLEAFATRNFKASFTSKNGPALSHLDDFFHFRETNLKHVPAYSHNQLRHCVSAGSKNAVFFYDGKTRATYIGLLTPHFHQVDCSVFCLNPEADRVRKVIDLQNRRGTEFFRYREVACVHASNDVLIVGALREGHYAMKSLSNTVDDTYIQGTFRNAGTEAGINHVHAFPRRQSGVPHAVFCDNDSYIRVVDCMTTQQVHAQKWDTFVNCSATSPDGRLRLHVSDDEWPIIAEAETGQSIARLPGHKDHGFACDWSPDGMTMATGHQDGLVQIWDARKLNSAVHILPAEMGGIRSLQFSPLGSGHPVLVMAEPADFVSIVDARTFHSKQDIEFLGEISGASMPPDGDTLFIGNADPSYGGIMEFERTGYTGEFKHRRLSCANLQQRKHQRRQAVYNASPDDSDGEELIEEASPEAKLERKWKVDDQDATIWQRREHDWTLDADMNNDGRALYSRKQRRRRHLGLEKLIC